MIRDVQSDTHDSSVLKPVRAENRTESIPYFLCTSLTPQKHSVFIDANAGSRYSYAHLLMPIKHAAIKDLRKNHKHAIKNARIKTHVKHLTRDLADLMNEGKTEEAKKALSMLQQTIAKAAKTHVLHKNNAKRKIANAFQLINKK